MLRRARPTLPVGLLNLYGTRAVSDLSSAYGTCQIPTTAPARGDRLYSMRGNNNKILKGSLQRVANLESVSVASADAAPASWWRSVMNGLGSGRRRRALATMQRLARHDVEDTISEADIQGWLSMLEAQSGSHKTDTNPAPPLHRRPDRR